MIILQVLSNLAITVGSIVITLKLLRMIDNLRTRVRQLENAVTAHEVVLGAHAKAHEGFAKARKPRALKAVDVEFDAVRDDGPDGAA